MSMSEQQVYTDNSDHGNGAGPTDVGDRKEYADGTWLSVDLQSRVTPSTNLPIPRQDHYGLSFADRKVARQENRNYRRIQHTTGLVGYAMESVEVAHEFAVYVADKGQDRIVDMIVSRPRLPDMNKQMELFGGKAIQSLHNKLGALLETHFTRVSEIV